MWGIESTTKEQMICLPSRPQVQIRSDPCCIPGQLLNLENIKDGEKKFFFSGQKSRIHKSEGGELKGDWEGLGVDRFEGTKEEEGGKGGRDKARRTGLRARAGSMAVRYSKRWWYLLPTLPRHLPTDLEMDHLLSGGSDPPMMMIVVMMKMMIVMKEYHLHS
jgi:hypothetical protein